MGNTVRMEPWEAFVWGKRRQSNREGEEGGADGEGGGMGC